MDVVLQLKPEIAARVEAARAQGVDMNAVLEQALPVTLERSQFLRREAERLTPRPTHKQLHDALTAIAELGKGILALPPDAFDREKLYEDRL